MKIPLTIDGCDGVFTVNDSDVSVGELVGVVRGEPSQGRGASQPFVDAGVRPGDRLGFGADHTTTHVEASFEVRVLAGIDAGRSIAVHAGEVSVGRSRESSVSLASNGVSLSHTRLGIDGDTVSVSDAGSRNGTVVRGHRVGEESSRVDLGEPVRCGPAVLSVHRVTPVDTPRSVGLLLERAASGPVPFYRSPVDLPAGPGTEVAAPAGPRRPRAGRPGLIGFLLPLLMAAALVWITGQWFYAMFALMGPVMMLVTLADKAGRNRRTRRRSKRRYQQERSDFAAELAESVQAEVARRWEMHPNLAEVVRRANVGGAALWTRRRSHPQFLSFAVGIADVPWEPPVTGLDDDLDDLEELVGQHTFLPQSPLAVQPATPSSAAAAVQAAAFTIGLAGERLATLSTARGLVVQSAVLHGPAEVRIVVICSHDRAADWDWAKWLPHVRPAFAGGRLLAVVADLDGRIDGGDIDDVLADADATASIVAVIDTVGLADSGDLAVRRLLRRAAGGAAVGVVLAATVDGLPDQTDVVVEHHAALGEATCRWPKEAGRSLECVVAGLSIETADTAARSLGRFIDPDAGGGSAALPTRVGLAELLGLSGAPDRADDVAQRWRSSASTTALIGVGEHGAVTVDLQRDGPHGVVIGSRGSGKTEQLSAMVLSLAASHSPEQVQFVLWGESFGALHRLPHVASSATRIDEGTLSNVVDGLEREFTRRERARVDEPGRQPMVPGPRLVVVIDDIDTIARVLPVAPDSFVRLLRRARGLGVHVLWSASRHQGGVMNELVDLSSIRIVQRVATPTDSVDLLGNESAARLERSLPGRSYLVSGRSDPREVQCGAVTVGAPHTAARMEVAPFTLVEGRSGAERTAVGAPDDRALVSLIAAVGANFPRPVDLLSPATAAVSALESPGLLELLGAHERGGLEAITDHWHTIDGDGFLRVPIGVDTDMRPVHLDIKESALAGMGPHGLLVGATGSGKSELLRTLVCGLALTHAPEALAFVLVDFKGGASFASLGRLPHVAGVVTNLADDLALVDRILAALGGEQKRRQELLAKAGNLGNVREYRAARAAGTLPPDVADEPLPELLVVVDEFAELLDQEPAFIDFFLTIGRVGRSLGIHLLLASQRLEEGKLRGLDTYLSYRLGLRTFSAAESRTVLGVPDAFSLPSAPGGGYLKVATTNFDRFQASYVSGVDEHGVSVLDAIIDRLADAAPRVHQIWLPPLEAALPLDGLMGGFVNDPHRGFAAARWPGSGRLTIPVGVADEPSRQRQLPLALDFAGAHGNLAIAGAPQSGKSLFLRSMVMSLAVTHTPEEVQIYALDLGGGTLEALAGLPHVGTVAARADRDLVRRVVGHVESVLAEREALFRAEAIDSAATFRSRRAEGALPADVGGDVFLLIDGWAAFREQFEALEPAIADLAARGLGYGIHVVVTLNRWMEMRANVLDAIGGRLELRLNSAIDSVIDRKRAAVIRPDQPGRGLHPSTLMFQVALPRLDGRGTIDSVPAATAVAVDHIASRWTGGRAPQVRLLPTHLEAESLDAPEAPNAVPVGVVEKGMATWQLDLTASEPHFSIFGDGESGKTSFLATWLTGLASNVPRERAKVVLVDYRRTLLGVVPETHLQAYAASEPAANDLLRELAEVMHSRLPGADVTAAQLRARSWWTGPDVYVVVDDYDLVVTPSGNPLSPLLPYLAQGRDVGLHLVTARRVSGAAKMMYEPITARVREVSPSGLILSGDREEGPLLGAVRATEQPPGRGVLVTRRHAPVLAQVALVADPDHAVIPE